jgi:hypothetical protein
MGRKHPPTEATPDSLDVRRDRGGPRPPPFTRARETDSWAALKEDLMDFEFGRFEERWIKTFDDFVAWVDEMQARGFEVRSERVGRTYHVIAWNW